MLLGNRAVVLCASSVLGAHTVILDSDLLLKYSEIPWSSVSARPVSVASDGDCMANTKGKIFPVGLNQGFKKESYRLLCTRL